MKKIVSVLTVFLLILSTFVLPFIYNIAAAVDVDVEVDDDFFSYTIVQDFEEGFLSGYDATGQKVARDPDELGEKYCHSCNVLQDNGNTYISVKNTGQWIQYLTNEAETGLLETDGTRYNVTFKYRMHEAVDASGTEDDPTNNVRLFIRSLTDVTPDLITSSGSSDKNGVILTYDASNTGWRTATIYDVYRTDDDGYLRVQVAGGSEKGVYTTVDLDDFVFTEVSKDELVIENNAPNGEVYVSSNGSDNNNGTATHPYKTLNKALTEVADEGKVNIVGTYALDSTFSWTNHNKAVTITGGEFNATAISGTYFSLGDSVIFDNITLTFDAGDTLFANGNKLTVNENVTLTNAITVYGGAADNVSVYGTDITLKAGTYENVYGGSLNATVFGDTNVYIGGTVNSTIDETDHDGTNCIYGGGKNCTIKGSTALTFTGNAKAHYIYGGSDGTGTGSSSISESTTVNFAGGKCVGLYGGSKNANHNGDARVRMTGGTIEQIFGGCQGESLTGNVDVMLTGGTVTRRVYGGCYNDYATLSGWQSENYVIGDITLSLGSGAIITYTSSDSDRSVYAHSRQKTLSSSENSKIVFLGDTAKTNLSGKLKAQDLTMKTIMSGVTAADSTVTYTYAADDANNIFTVSGDTSATATLSLDSSVAREYTGKAIEPAVITYSSADIEMPDIDITYINNVNIGTATATATINGVSVSLDFEITNTSPKDAEYYEQTDRWFVFSGNADKTNSYYNDVGLKQIKASNVGIEEDASVYNTALVDSTKSLKLNTYGQFAATKMVVEPYSYYDLEFYYSTDKITSSRIFDYVAVAEPDAKISKSSIGNLAYICNDLFELNYEDAFSYTVKNSSASPNGLTLNNGLGWHKITLTFYTSDNSEVLFSLRSGVIEESNTNNYAYIDGISLKQADIETAYNSKAAIRSASVTDSSNMTEDGLRIYNSIKADWLTEADGSKEIIEYGSIAIRQGYMERKFPDKSAPDLEMLSLKGKGVGHGVAYSKGKAASKYCTVSARGEIIWQTEKTVFEDKIFTTYLTGFKPSNYDDEYLISTYAIAADGTVYYGDTASVSIFKVAYAIDHDTNITSPYYKYSKAAFKYFVTSSDENKENYENWCSVNGLKTGNLFAKQIVDFDSDNIVLEANDRMEITEAQSYDGTQSKMLHVRRGDYPSTTTILNSKTTYNSDTDDVLTFKVKASSVYKVTFRAKVKSDDTVVSKDINGDEENESPWFAVYANYSGSKTPRQQMAYLLWGKKDVWLDYTYYLQTEENQNVFSFTFDAGQITPEAWIDDIVVEETDYAVFEGHGEALEETTINFDDYAVNSEYSERLHIAEAPVKDGNTSNSAMKFINKDYGSASLNPTTTRSGTDAVLSKIPVKPNTLYSLSYWLYVTENTGSVSWFKFYYFPDNEIYSNYGLVDATSMAERGKWVKFETQFTTTANQTTINLALDSATNPPEMWLDDISLKEIKAGGLAIDNEATYSEAMYNILGKEDYEEVAAQITAGKTNKYKISVDSGAVYTFGITVNSSVSSSSRVFLSFDGENPMGASNADSPDMIATADGTSRRYGFQFVSSDQGYVYIVVENDDAAMNLETPYLFRTYSLSTFKPMGFAEIPDTELSVNTDTIIDELTVFDSASGTSTVSADYGVGTYAVQLLDRKEELTPLICQSILCKKQERETASKQFCGSNYGSL